MARETAATLATPAVNFSLFYVRFPSKRVARKRILETPAVTAALDCYGMA